MRMQHCDNEERIARAARLNLWSEELRSHAGNCPVCGDVAMIAGFMSSQVADELAADAPAPLPDPQRIYWTARFEARREAARRASRPIAIVESAALAAGALGTILALIWMWPPLVSLFGSALSAGARASAASPAAMATPGSLVWVAVLTILPILLAGSVLNATRVAGRS